MEGVDSRRRVLEGVDSQRVGMRKRVRMAWEKVVGERRQ